VTDGAGTSSHHAEYDGAPVALTSCSVPVWIRVLSVTVQPASRQPPPIPVQADEYSASFRVCWLTFGTVHVPETDSWRLLTLGEQRALWNARDQAAAPTS